MGSEASKPAEETPDNWDHGNGFQIISPRSDLSNPSDIHRVHRHPTRNTNPTQSDRNRRVSKTITKAMPPNPHHNINAPQSRYFPTTESERESDRASKQNILVENKENERPKRSLKKIFGGCFSDSTAQQVEVELTEPEKAQTVSLKATKVKNGMAIVDTTRNKRSKSRNVNDFDASVKKSATRNHQMPRLSGVSDQTPHDSKKNNLTTKDGTNLQKLVSSAEHSFVIRETEGSFMKNNSLDKNGVVDIALHQEEDYFARLTAEPSRYSEVQESPMAPGYDAPMTLPSVLDKGAPTENLDSPVSNLFANDDLPESTNREQSREDLLQQNHDDQDRSEAPSHATGASEFGGKSVVNSLDKFHTQIRLNSMPEVNSEDEEKSVKVFLDETMESSLQNTSKAFDSTTEDAPSNDVDAKLGSLSLDSHILDDQDADGQGAAIDKATDKYCVPEASPTAECGSPSSIMGSKDDVSVDLSYFRPNEMNIVEAFRPKGVVPDEPLKQVATLGRNSVEKKSKSNKLESLFRPILPSLSVDDVSAAASYDPYEIKVTESAPSIMENRDYRTLALRPNYGSPQSIAAPKSRQLAAFSPSMMSIDSQVDESPARTKVMVSDQALNNAEFLFSSDYKCTQKRLQNERDSGIFSISTLGARSRMSQRSQVKPVKIPVKNAIDIVPDEESRASYGSRGSSNSQRRVRFSDATSRQDDVERIDTTLVERKMSDLTDRTREYGSDEENEYRPQSNEDAEENQLVSPTDQNDEPASRIQWAYTTKDGITTVTPHRKGTCSMNVTNSPYLRFQAAKSNYETSATNDITQNTIEIPMIESKVSDLTESLSDFGGRLSNGSAKSFAMEETIPEEEVEADTEPEFDEHESEAESEHVLGDTGGDLPSSPPKLNWSYSEKDGVIFGATPQIKGRALKNATNSPFLRFKDAKNKFGTKNRECRPVKSRKSSPKKKSRQSVSSRTTTKPQRNSGGGVVSSRIDALNKRVRETRKMRRLAARKTAGNPRKHAPVETNIIRTQAIMTYKTDMVGIEKRNYMSAVKFNRIPDPMDDDDDASVESSMTEKNFVEITSSKGSNLYGIQEEEYVFEHESENIEDYHEKYADKDDRSGFTSDKEDEFSRMSEGAATVDTVRQSKDSRSSTSTAGQSSSSQSFGNVRRQVFRGHDSISTYNRQSMASSGESTTLSSLFRQDNSGPAFRSDTNGVEPTDPGALHLSPTQRTPMEARKWRSLAAAVQQKDAMKRSNKKTGGKSKKGLSERNGNTLSGTTDTARFARV